MGVATRVRVLDKGGAGDVLPLSYSTSSSADPQCCVDHVGLVLVIYCCVVLVKEGLGIVRLGFEFFLNSDSVCCFTSVIFC